MNIDIVNKQVSTKLGLNEKRVALINQFYWRKCYDHFYDYDPRPLNIENVCVFYHDAWLVKKTICYYIKKLRKLLVSKKFRTGSDRHLSHIETYKKLLRNYWQLRKAYKYTN